MKKKTSLLRDILAGSLWPPSMREILAGSVWPSSGENTMALRCFGGLQHSIGPPAKPQTDFCCKEYVWLCRVINKSKVMMPASFLDNQSAGTVLGLTESPPSRGTSPVFDCGIHSFHFSATHKGSDSYHFSSTPRVLQALPECLLHSNSKVKPYECFLYSYSYSDN